MAYVNEYIPEDDLKKYNFAELNKRLRKGGGTARDWTIDRDADIWLRQFYVEPDHTAVDGGYTGISAWDLYWKGALMLLELKVLETGGNRGEHCWARKRLLSINIPPKLESQRPQILKDIEATFVAYKDGGIFATSTNFTFTLKV